MFCLKWKTEWVLIKHDVINNSITFNYIIHSFIHSFTGSEVSYTFLYTSQCGVLNISVYHIQFTPEYVTIKSKSDTPGYILKVRGIKKEFEVVHFRLLKVYPLPSQNSCFVLFNNLVLRHPIVYNVHAK